MDKDTRLKLAVQKSGRLTDPSLDLLSRCGLKLSRGKDQLMGYGENMPLDVLFVRDDDIPDLVQEDVCDLGLVGLNVLEEKRLELAARGATARFEQLRTLDFGRCRLSLAVPDGMAYEGPRFAARQAHRHHLSVHCWRITCASETSRRRSSRCPARWRSRRGWAAPTSSAISSPRARRCRPITCAKCETVLESQAVLIRTPRASCRESRRVGRAPAAAHRWRAAGARRASTSCCTRRARRCREIRELLPGSESPTIIPLEGSPDKVAVHAVCRENVFWETLESLKNAGASALLVLPVEKMLRLTPCRSSTGNELDATGTRAALARPRSKRERDIDDAGARRSSARCAAMATRRCCAFAARFDRRAARQRCRSRREEFAAARSGAEARADRGARARHRQRAALPRGAAAAAAVAWRRCRACAASGVFRPIPAVGLYVPAGSAPLPSAVDHAGRSGALAGCPQRVLCTPPDARRRGQCRRAGRGAALRHRQRVQGRRRAGDRRAWRTAPQSVPKVDKIFGPGNALGHGGQAARRGDPAGAACDLPAGPSEVLVIADDDADAELRRGRPAGAGRARRAVRRPCWSRDFARAGGRRSPPQFDAADARAVARRNPRQVAARTAAASSCRTSTTAIEVSQRYAPEHLILQTREPRRWLDARAQRRLGVPRRVVAGVDGRLLLRHQPRAADLRLRARLQRPVGRWISRSA